MDVNWYVAEAIVAEHLADLRVAALRHRMPGGAERPCRAWPSALGPAVLRRGHRLLGGLGAMRATPWKRPG